MMMKYISNSAHISRSLVGTLPLNNHQTSECNRNDFHPFHSVEKSLLCNGRLLIKLTILTASLGRVCTLAAIFFAMRAVSVRSSASIKQLACGFLTSHSIHSSFQLLPLHHHYILLCIFTVDAIATCSLNKQIEEVLSCCMSRYWLAKSIFSFLNPSDIYLTKYENCARLETSVDFKLNYNEVTFLDILYQLLMNVISHLITFSECCVV